MGMREGGSKSLEQSCCKQGLFHSCCMQFNGAECFVEHAHEVGPLHVEAMQVPC